MRAYTFTSVDNIHVGATGHNHSRRECKDYAKEVNFGLDRKPFYVDCDACAAVLLKERNWTGNPIGAPQTHDEILAEERLMKEGDALTAQMARAFADAAAVQVSDARKSHPA